MFMNNVSHNFKNSNHSSHTHTGNVATLLINRYSTVYGLPAHIESNTASDRYSVSYMFCIMFKKIRC